MVAGPHWNDPESLYTHLSQNTNIIEAARRLAWDDVVLEDAVVLDLGSGSGWLAGMLTQHPRVQKVVAWDASPALLRDFVPAMVSLVGGDLSKVQRVCGQFTPLLLDDASIDLAVMSSAFHHSSSPESLLDDLVRVVRPGGAIVLLNEVPFPGPVMLGAIGTRAIAAAVNSMTTRLTISKPGHVAADHLLYDDALGDRALTEAQWRRLFRRHGLDVQIVDTSLPSYPRRFRRRHRLEKNLTHFVLRPQGRPNPL